MNRTVLAIANAPELCYEGGSPLNIRVAALLALLLMIPGVRSFAQPAEGSRVPDAAQFVGQPQGSPLTGDALKRETHRVGGLLRCPVCQGLSVTDSPAAMAVSMKEQVGELLARGYTEKQILAYFERSYGQFVLLEPKFEGITSLVWLLPILALALGMVVVIFKMKNLARGPRSVATAPEIADATVESTDDAYVSHVRDLVGGGKP